MKKKIICSFIFLSSLFLLFTFTASVSANQRQAYIVGTDQLNIRANPDSHAAVIGKLQAGQKLVGFQEKHGWIQTYYGGKEAWVASHYLIKDNGSPVRTQVTTPSKNITINANAVRLRTGPSTNHAIITHASKGDTYQLNGTDGDWHQISLSDGTVAWVFSSLTSASGQAYQPPAVAVTEKQTNKQVRNTLTGLSIVLDAGHGGIDPGAFSLYGDMEKDVTLATAKKIAETLKNAGATVQLTRLDDSYLSLRDRVSTSEIYQADAFVSIHYNAHSSRTPNGVSTHYASDQGRYLAQSIQSELNNELNMTNRGIRHDPFYVLRKNSRLAVLVELGFLSNDYDISLIHSERHANDVARAIKNGLINYFNSY